MFQLFSQRFIFYFLQIIQVFVVNQNWMLCTLQVGLIHHYTGRMITMTKNHEKSAEVEQHLPHTNCIN